MALLDVRNLCVEFTTHDGPFRAVDGVDLSLDKGELLAVIGESGSGKSVAMLALMGLLPWDARVSADVMDFDGIDLLGLSDKARRQHIGRDISMISQEPMSSLNPRFTVGFQLREALAHRQQGETRRQRHQRAAELLEQVGISAPVQRLRAFPHQLSGDISQRVMIALALASRPKLLIADEPTTTLDVTVQAQILDLLTQLQRESDMAMVLVTHDMGVVADTAERVSVYYAGQVVEQQPVHSLFDQPQHPYTAALLDALPERTQGKRLSSMAGTVPGLKDRPQGCLFAPRCQHAQTRCHRVAPASSASAQGRVRCHMPLHAVPAC